MFFRLAIEIRGVGYGATKRGDRKWGGCLGEVVGGCWVLLPLVCVCVYFYCCSVGCLCQGLQGGRFV
jgi:hypothetical protein